MVSSFSHFAYLTSTIFQCCCIKEDQEVRSLEHWGEEFIFILGKQEDRIRLFLKHDHIRALWPLYKYFPFIASVRINLKMVMQ